MGTEKGVGVGARFEQGSVITYSALGHEQLTVGSTAVGLPNLPNLDRLRRVVIRNLNQPINWQDDGNDPTSSTGFHALADEIVVYDGEFDLIKFIRASTATADADVRIAYYGT